jgi:hypothetical protein
MANGADQMAWATGAEFQQRLDQPVDILWSGNPLRDAIKNLSETQRVAILIDRRVDPGRKLTATIKNTPFEIAIQSIAEQNELGVSRLGDVIYLGPRLPAERLRPIEAAFKQRVRQLPMPIQRKLSRAKAMVWMDLATPRELLEGLTRQNDFTIANLNRIPHDLWAAADLPPLSLVDRLVLIASQFDLTFKINAEGTILELVPVPEVLPEATKPFADASLPRPSPKSISRSKPSEAASASNLERIRIQRLTIQDEQLGSVLRQLAERLGLELKIDEAALQAGGISLDQRVTMTVENVSIDELFRQLLKSSGLIAHRRQKIVEIVPMKRP